MPLIAAQFMIRRRHHNAIETIVRRYRPEDATGVAALILPIQRDEFGIPITLEEQPDLLDIAGFYQRGSGSFWVALSAGTVVGSIGLLDIGNRQGALRKMFVAKAHRGRDRGVAQELLDVLFGWAAVRGLTEVILGTTAKFVAAHRFYEKNGFLEIARENLPEAFPVMAVDSRFYRRSVGAHDAASGSRSSP